MTKTLDDDGRSALMRKLSKNLPVFRAKLSVSQDELASRLGTTRQTLSAIESGQREMTWVMFLALVLVFFRNDTTKRLLVALEIYTPALDEFLTIGPESRPARPQTE